MTAAEPTATGRVYDALYAAVPEHRLVPGTRLREAELAERFAVGRTVVRQALQRLAQNRLVELQHNRGAQVTEPSHARDDRAASVRLSEQSHRRLAELSGNPVSLHMLDELLPTTSLLTARDSGGRALCVAYRHLREIEKALVQTHPHRGPGPRPRIAAHANRVAPLAADAADAVRRGVSGFGPAVSATGGTGPASPAAC